VGYERASKSEENIGLFSVMLLTPRSRGWVRMHEHGPEISLNMLSDEYDVVAMRDAVKDLIGLVSNGEIARNFSRIYIDDNGNDVSTLKEGNDDDMDSWILRNLRPVSHVASSCAQAVTSTGLLSGVSGVYVADASVLPSVPACTPAGPVTMGARRIADEIRGALQ
jgi:choline dehydrogenase